MGGAGWFFPGWILGGGGLGVQGPSCERISVSGSNFSPHTKTAAGAPPEASRGLQGPPGASRGLQGPPEALRGLQRPPKPPGRGLEFRVKGLG